VPEAASIGGRSRKGIENMASEGAAS
jgi:hypothetical protein